MASLFNQSIINLKGVGGKRALLFEKIGVHTIGALLYYYPRGYEDLSNPIDIASAQVESICCIKGKVISDVTSFTIRKGLSIQNLKISDDYRHLCVTFFNNPFIIDRLKKFDEYLFYGKVTVRNGMKQMVAPSIYSVDEFKAMRPIYKETKGLNSKVIMSAIKNAISMIPLDIKEPIPDKIREKYNIPTLRFAIENIHFPKDRESLELAKKYFAFEEFFALQLGILSLKAYKKQKNFHVMGKDYTREYLDSLPFKPTKAQERVVKECIKDMKNKECIMNRLIQGDVGAGKTAVMAAVSYNVVRNGSQVAIMVPTEVLAKQHFEFLSNTLSKFDINVACLVGSIPESKKKKIREELLNGTIDILVGTHAIISDNVKFDKLSLVVTDEQHRFGVMQRTKLLQKGDRPHTLVMSATPIPRTLSFIIYGDLDISILDELPPGRKKIDTFCISSNKKKKAFSLLKEKVNLGQQGYIVCPVIDSEDDSLVSIKNYMEEIRNDYFHDYNIECIYGSMKSSEKEYVMQRFIDKKIDILVSTTVIEVGINVPNATVMIIENAERFGLSQLHQLRGRIGRGKEESFCILISDTKNIETIRRLKVISDNNDGFKIADEDLKLRGPGDFFGERQHGMPILRISNISDNIDLLMNAKCEAEAILNEDCNLEEEKNKRLKALLIRLYGKTFAELKSF